MFRAKCPTCGRKQSADLSQAGQTIFCAACGTRFVVELIEQPDEESTIPDVDFFPPAPPPTAPLTAPPAAPLPAGTQISSPTGPSAQSPLASVLSSIAAPPSPPLPPAAQPLPLPGRRSVAVPPPPKSTAVHEPFVPGSRRSRWLLPVVIGGVLLICTTLTLGIVLGYMLSRPGQMQVTSAAPPSASKPISPSPVVPVKSIASPILPPPPPPVIAPPTTELATPEPAPVGPPKPQPVAAAVIPVIAPLPKKFLPVRPTTHADDLDDDIGKAINRGVTELLNHFSNGQMREYNPEQPASAGMDALVVYALLHAGEAINDLRLTANSQLVGQMLDALKKMPMDHEVATYSRSLRAAALGVYHRKQDKNALRDDCAWLIADSHDGAFSYFPPPPAARGARGGARFSAPWDNSNSQYGALGVWAALEAGVEVPNSFWLAVQKHWLDCQLPDGEWGYLGYGTMGRLSMTVAGITTLLVTEDQLDAREVVATLGHQPFNPNLQRGLNWLEAGNNSVRIPQSWRAYNLFGLERAALASGFKYFGTHDWYRELATQQIGLQEPDGSWSGSDALISPGESDIVDTAYSLLFLSRGRHPIFMNKLRFDGFWSNRPRDIANLTRYASTALERPLNWQVVSLKSDWSDWMDSPVLYIASHEGLKLSDEEVNKLRSFAGNGGLIFTHADGDSSAFSKSIADIAHRLWPQYPLADLKPTDPIFSSMYQIKQPPRLQGISNGSRLLLVHSPTDLNKQWQLRDTVNRPVDFQMGVNIFIYAAGRANLRNRLKTPLVPEPQIAPILTTTLAKIRHPGNWNPEPVALPRFARIFFGQTSVKVNVIDTDPDMLDPVKMPLAHLTGTGPIHFSPAEFKAIHDYVNNGGTLLIDAFGGSTEFRNSMVSDFLPHAFPRTVMAGMPSSDPLLRGTGPGMSKVALRMSPWREEFDGTTTLPLQYLTEGKGLVIYSTVDVTTGLLGINTWGINGYEPETAYNLVRNVLLSILEK
jgi:hypothetical protein